MSASLWARHVCSCTSISIVRHNIGTEPTLHTICLVALSREMRYRLGAQLTFATPLAQPNKGLSYMFLMMNEARVGVGSCAAALGTAGYYHSLEYAMHRQQGRLVTAKDPASPQVCMPLSAPVHPRQAPISACRGTGSIVSVKLAHVL